jgi:hypothetical protein
MLVQAEIGNQSLELPALILKLLEPSQLANVKPAVQLLPTVKCLLGNPIGRITSGTGVPVSASFFA